MAKRRKAHERPPARLVIEIHLGWLSTLLAGVRIWLDR
jgi:hypothetical protein